ncbi:VIT1/CCC1 transporter family protein [Millisia brevis]|uniref:VIT1/CCC1 transporter family protein n=1 Tax=Millisia brevis TaxID=264148 RepID=UPI001FDEC4F6|nr:VIT1/CCC1 transporter family protein [Millisia brevis]
MIVHPMVSWWRRTEPAAIRERITDINDGIIAVAGMGLGLAGAEVAAATSYAVIAISATAGALSVAGTKLGESFADREAQQATVAEERRLLALTPDEERAELVAWFEAKGVSTDTARQVAKELSATDALSTQLEIEYGIRDLTTRRDAWSDGLWSGLAFLLGALLPVLVAIVTPLPWRTEWTVAVASASLVATSVVLARRGKSRIWLTILRSVAVGLGTLAASYLLGDWLI